jgi:hypothetical protein
MALEKNRRWPHDPAKGGKVENGKRHNSGRLGWRRFGPLDATPGEPPAARPG